MEIPLGTKAAADVVKNGDNSSKDGEYDSVDDGSVTSSDDGSEDEPEAEGQSKTLHFKTKKNENLERFY